MVETPRGKFEIFVKGEGIPICVTHHYSEFNNSGDYFAEAFTQTHKVFLVNLKGAGNSSKASQAHELSMFDSVYDLEAIREKLGYSSWVLAGHSTGGMMSSLWYSFF
jgi:proline iminopeptidase